MSVPAENTTCNLQCSPESTAVIQNVLSVVSDIAAELTSAGVIRYVNVAWQSQLGYTSDESVGKHLSNYVIATEWTLSEQFDGTVLYAVAAKGHVEVAIRDHSGVRYSCIMHASRGPNDQLYVVFRNLALNCHPDEQLTELTLNKSLATLAYRTDDAIAITNDAMGVIWVNDALVRCTGYALSDIRNKHLCELLQLSAHDYEQLQTGRFANGEVQVIRKDGASYWIKLELLPVHDDHKAVLHYVAVMHDVTHYRDVAAQLLSQSIRLDEEREFAALRAEVGTALNRDASLEEILSGSCEAIGNHIKTSSVQAWLVCESDVQLIRVVSTATPFTAAMQPTHMPLIGQQSAKLTKLNAAILVDVMTSHADYRYSAGMREQGVESIVFKSLIASDRVVGMLVLYATQQITPSLNDALGVVADTIALGIVRKQAEEALQRGLVRQLAIINSALDCIITIDRHGTIIEFNPAAESSFGYQRDEVLGKPFSGLIIQQVHWVNHQVGIQQYLANGGSQLLKQRRSGLPAKRKDGTEFLVELTVVPMELNGEPIFTAFLRDVTEQARYESDLHQAKEAAEAANLAKSQFLANMSHELRTPMGVVIGYADVLQDPRIRDDQRLQIIKSIRRNGEHLLLVINDILDLSKIEAGRIELEHVSCKLWHLVDEVLSAVHVKAADKLLKLDFTPIGRLPRMITTDPTRLRQILLNILDNAIKFTPAQKRVDLRIQLNQTDADSPKLVIEVIDEGLGMSSEELGKLFKPFVQADASTTRVYGGTGLGLSICKRLVEALGGDIHVRSQLGIGTCFSIILPLDRTSLDTLVDEWDFDVSRTSSLRSLPHGTGPNARKLTGLVLLAEDNPDNRNILRYFLERAGLRVDTVENGFEVIEKSRTADYDIVLMDMQMPLLDGYSATSKLRAVGYTRPILALTAHAMVGDRERCLQAGCDNYMTKPVDPNMLIETVSRYLRPRSWAIKMNSLSRTVPPPVQKEPLPPVQVGKHVDAIPADLLASYQRSLPDKAKQLLKACDADDRTHILEMSHKLRGSAGMYGLVDVSSTAGLVEDACRENQDMSLVRELVVELQTLIASLCPQQERVAANRS